MDTISNLYKNTRTLVQKQQLLDQGEIDFLIKAYNILIENEYPGIQEIINSDVVTRVNENDLPTIQAMLTHPDLTLHGQVTYKNYQAYSNACYQNYRELVEFFLYSPLLKENVPINDPRNEAVISVCQFGTLEMLKYLVANGAQTHMQNDEAFCGACQFGFVEIMDYLLTSPEVSNPANVHAQDDSGFPSAAFGGQIPAMRYLFDKYVIPPAAQAKAFKFAFDKYYNHVLQYLIFDCDINMNLSGQDNLMAFLQEKEKHDSYEPTMKMLAQKKFYGKLNSNLPDKTHNIVKNKI